MALIKCVDCGTAHSKDAKACPKCGKPNSKSKSQAQIMSSIAILIIVAIAGIATMAYISAKQKGAADAISRQRDAMFGIGR